jgi:hypothetical protein
LVGAIGVFALSILGLAWIWQTTILLTGGTVFGYFAGVPSVAVTILVSAAFYVVFLPVQAFASNALQYAKGVANIPSFWGRFFTLVLWVGMVSVIWYLAHNDARIATDLVRMYHDVTGHFGL